MRGKAAFFIGAGLGYLFGTKAGRERFEQIKGWANQTWSDPKVQAKVNEYGSTAARVAKDKGGALAGKLKSGSSAGTSGVAGMTGSEGESGTGSVSSTTPPSGL